MIFKKGLKCICGCGGFRDKVDRLHESPDASVLLGVDHVLATDDADDIINVVFIDRKAGEGDRRVFFKNFFER